MLWDETLHDRRCAQCWGVMISRLVDESKGPRSERKIICPDDCKPGGHVSATFVQIQKQKDHMDYLQAARNYPELSGYVAPSEDDVEEASETLFGE